MFSDGLNTEFYLLKGSHAARYQSRHYGGEVPDYSTFSRLQSHGALGLTGTINGEEAQAESTFWKPPIYARLLSWIAGILAVRAMFL